MKGVHHSLLLKDQLFKNYTTLYVGRLYPWGRVITVVSKERVWPSAVILSTWLFNAFCCRSYLVGIKHNDPHTLFPFPQVFPHCSAPDLQISNILILHFPGHWSNNWPIFTCPKVRVYPQLRPLFPPHRDDNQLYYLKFCPPRILNLATVFSTTPVIWKQSIIGPRQHMEHTVYRSILNSHFSSSVSWW